MTIPDLQASLDIFKLYYSEESQPFQFEYGSLYMSQTDLIMDDDDVEALIELGWSQEDVDGEMTLKQYDFDMPWCHYG